VCKHTDMCVIYTPCIIKWFSFEKDHPNYLYKKKKICMRVFRHDGLQFKIYHMDFLSNNSFGFSLNVFQEPV